ncbi:hypothetical protein [Cellulosimicrobium arenosum]|uniref:Type II toxin-antitoxin system VapC family toxin n=1 Tax=Cellulosimicrobium arenosum TaxID=2708133 RepID=A0A927G8C9_9MICO|nr:hypothetical protein [Cellulosimicrobium arenosum]MBD8078781.1 hypothetical protein [Cellulosimicrobium arenosum]
MSAATVRTALDVPVRRAKGLLDTHLLLWAGLPPVHRYPSHRLLVAQAITEGIPLGTHDAALDRSPGPIQVA